MAGKLKWLFILLPLCASCGKKEEQQQQQQVCWHNETGYPLTGNGQIGQQAIHPPNLSIGQTTCEAFGGGSYWSIDFAAQDGTPFARYAGQVFDRIPDPIEIRIQDNNLTYDWGASRSGTYAFQRTEIILSGNDTVSIKVDSILGSIQKSDRINELKIHVDATLLGVAVFIKNDYDFSIGSNGFGQLSPSTDFGYQEITALPSGNARKVVILGKRK